MQKMRIEKKRRVEKGKGEDRNEKRIVEKKRKENRGDEEK